VNALDHGSRCAAKRQVPGNGAQAVEDKRRQGRLRLSQGVQRFHGALRGDVLSGANEVLRLDEHTIGFHAISFANPS
jgi:hypothetical protein